MRNNLFQILVRAMPLKYFFLMFKYFPQPFVLVLKKPGSQVDIVFLSTDFKETPQLYSKLHD